MHVKPDYLQTVLDNHLPVVASPDPDRHYFVVGALVGMGPRFEPLDKTGISHFIEHMLFQGSENYPTSVKITRAIDRITGQILASTGPEYAYFGIMVHRKYATEAIEILADLLQRPLFDAKEIEQEKKIILEERAQFHDSRQRNLSVDELLYNLLTRADDPDISIVGTASGIGAFDRDLLVEYWRQFFVARNMVLTVAGGFEFDETTAAISKHFAGMPAGTSADPQPDHDVQAGPRWIHRRQAGSTLSVGLAWRTVPFDHPDYAAYVAVSEFLGAGTNSRLFNRIREELSLVYDISSVQVSGSRFGWLEIDTTVRPKNYIPTLKEIFRVIRQFTSEPIDEAELAVCKEKLRCSLEIAHDDPAESASWYAKQTLFANGRGPRHIISLADELEQIENLTVDQLFDVAKRVFTPANGYLVVVGPVNWRLKRRTQRLIRKGLTLE